MSRVYRRMTQLDDGCLIEIFTRIGNNVRVLVWCSLVCKRWSSLCWAVPALRFSFIPPKTLGAQEDIISNILRKTAAAANCLEELRVSLWESPAQAQATGEWLVHAGTSLKELNLFFHNGKWGPAVWTALSSFPCLESLDITGDFIVPVPNLSRFQKLTSCRLSSRMTGDVLEAVLAACPVLKNLELPKFGEETLRISSATLECLTLLLSVDSSMHQVYLDAPMLARLVVGAKLVECSIATSKNLREMELYSACEFDSQVPFGKLQSLTLHGEWTCRLMVAVFRNAPVVTDLKLEYFELDFTPLPVGRTLGCLHNLKTVHFDGMAVRSFRSDGGAFVFEELTIHLWLDDRMKSPKSTLKFLKRLMDVHCARWLVVHCHPRDAEDAHYKRFLDFAMLHPDRVEFKQDKQRYL